MITYLQDSDVTLDVDEALRSLLALCFTNEPRFAAQRFCNEMPSHRWVIRSGDQLIAHVATHDKSFQIGTAMSTFCGVAEVCVHPDHRGRGLAGRLLAAAESHHAACDFSILLGAPYVYTRYGYQTVKNVIFPLYSEEPFGHAMVKCLSADAWPGPRVVLGGPHF